MNTEEDDISIRIEAMLLGKIRHSSAAKRFLIVLVINFMN
jgi:hypothetical protein